jgi:hypothetical protein
MTTQPSFFNIEYVGSPLMESTMWTPVLQTEHKKGGIGSILGIVASIAVPFLAGPIAATIFGGASILGSAAVGAALGAGTSALTGGNPLTGALMGGFGAGFSSYMAGNGLFTDPVTGATNNGLMFGNATTPQTASIDPNGISNVTAGNWQGSMVPQMTPTPTADLAAVGAENVSYTGGTVLDPATGQYVSNAGFNIPSVNPNNLTTVGTSGAPTNLAATTATGVAPGQVLQLPPNFSTAGFTQSVPGLNGIDPTGFLGFGTVDPKIPKFLMDTNGTTFLNPTWQQAAAAAKATSSGFSDALIRGGVNLAGMAVSQLAPNPQQEIADKYAAELSRLKKTDQAGYEAKKKEVEGLIASAKAMDPAYFGQQAANSAKIAGTRGLMESFREMPMAGLRSPEFTSAEGRRANIGIGQNVGTAYDQGYGTGLTARQTALSSAINQMPNTPSRYIEGLRSMAGMQDNANRYGGQSATGYANLFGTLARPFMTSQV